MAAQHAAQASSSASAYAEALKASNDEDRPGDESDLTSIAETYREQVFTLVDAAQIRVQLMLLSVVKALVYGLTLVLLAVSAWLLLLGVLLNGLVHLGLPVPLTLAVGCALTFGGAWVNWRLLLRSIRLLGKAVPGAGSKGSGSQGGADGGK